MIDEEVILDACRAREAYRVWNSMEERDFHIYLDRDFRDCKSWVHVMGWEEDTTGAMFELGPMEIATWHWQEALGVTHPLPYYPLINPWWPAK